MANAICWAIANGDWTNSATWADGRIPDTSGTDAVYTNGFTVNVNTNINVASLNNTARARDVATPAMTSDVTPAGTGYIIYSSIASSYFAASAFDKNFIAGGTSGWQSTTANSGWLGYVFNSPRVIQAYAIFANNSQTRTPRTWTFEGSNDGVNWTVLESVANNPIAAGGVYRSTNINLTSYSYYRVNITAVHTTGEVPNILELELYNLYTTIISSGGSFNFNTAGVTANVTGATPLSNGATNLITYTLNSGSVTITITSNVTSSVATSSVFNITGNGNLIVNGTNFTAGFNGAVIFTKTGTGDLTINGNLIGGTGNGNPSNSFALNISAGNTYVNGNISSNAASGNTGLHAVNATGTANLYVTGNITGGSVGISSQGIVFGSSGIFIVTGIVYGGVTSNGISSTTNFTVIGNVIAGSVSAISSASAISVFATGNVTASSTANAVYLTNASAQVFLKGNMLNNAGKMAIYAPRIWVDKDTAMYSQFFTSGGADRTLYSADTFPNTPIPANVRSGITFGPDNSLTGTLIIPPTNTVAQGVQVDNTTGTALLTVQEILDEIKNSSDPMAIRLRNSITPEIMGKLLQWAKI